MKKDEFSKMFDPAKKEAAKQAAVKIKAAGFRVLNSGWGGVLVVHEGGKRSTIVLAEEADEFIATAKK